MNRSPLAIRDRIKELRRVPASSLLPHPANWRTHPDEQRAGLRAVLREIGWAGAALARELPDGRLQLIDGHLRQEEAVAASTDDANVPVLVLDVTEEEALKILATHDPLGAMAEADKEGLASLLASLETQDADFQALLSAVEEVAGIDFQTLLSAAEEVAGIESPAADPPAREKDDDETIDEQFAVFVRCADERDQKVVLAELDRHGLDVRALCVGVPKLKPVQDADAQPIAVKGKKIRREVKVARSPRVMQMEGMFDVPPAKKNVREWRVDLELSKPWSIGLIVGPSGCGKTTIARELFEDKVIAAWEWPENESILDGFPEGLSIQEIVGYLSSVGFSSPPAWVKPFHVLSNGEQFRVTLARTLAESPDLAVVDEFTSVVDRQVAQIGSAAVAKAVRARGGRFVAVTCHYDVEEWLQPDWKYDVPSGVLEWRLLRRRPDVQLSIRRVDGSWWQVFRDHHYLSHNLHRAAGCYLGEVGGRPAAFTAVLYYPHRNGGWWREHRMVCLPDFQGVGIGNAMSEYVASVYAATGKEYRSTTSHPAMIRHRLKSPMWMITRRPSLASFARGAQYHMQAYNATSRMTAGFLYIGPQRPEDAARLGLLR